MIYMFNVLNFVAGHGTVVQPASINIVFGCKLAQQYSRTHQLSFIRAVGWNAQNAFALVARAYHSYSSTLQFSCISYEVWVTARFDVLFKSLNVTKTINTFLAHFRFLKKLQIFLMLLGIMHAAHPYQNLHWYPLTSSKNIRPKISIPYFAKMISIYFCCWWVEDVSFQSPLVGPCIHTHTEL